MKLPRYVREQLLKLLPDEKLETEQQAIRALNKFLEQYDLAGIVDDDIITLAQMVATFNDNVKDTDIVTKEFCTKRSKDKKNIQICF